MADTYKKNKGNAGLEGIQFQLNLLTISLLNVLRNRTNWKISTENLDAGKYDDIVIELSEKNAALIQSKYKDKKKVTKDQLLSHNSKNCDFSLPKYFFSYEEIKKKFKTKTVIICTNTDVNEKDLEDVITSHPVGSDSMLHHEGDSCSFFTFNENILSDLKVNAEIYYDKNLQGKNINKKIITEENLKDFLKNLQFFSGYPSGDKLNKIIVQLLSRLKDTRLYRKTTPKEIYKKMEEWFKQPRGEYLTHRRAKAMFCEMKSDKYCESLEDYEVSFELNNFSFADSKRIYHVTTEKGYLLQMLKIYRALQKDRSKKLFINPDDSTEVQTQMMEAFELHPYTFLIMIWNKIAEQISGKLRQILEKDQYKKIIFISESNSNLTHYAKSEEVIQLDGHVAFEDLSNDSQGNLLTSKNLIFQGELISPEILLDRQALKDCTKRLESQILEKLVRGEGIRVGKYPLDLDEDTARYYIGRTFMREIKVIDDEKGGSEKKEEVFSEEGIYDVKEKMILIGDTAGMGKSTVMTKLAVTIKENHPHLWVIRINLNDYTKILKDSLKKNMKTISVVDLLNSVEETKLTNEFEEYVFSVNEKVVLMMDGVDEVSPDYTGLILDLLVQCQQADNFAKVFITTRPHLIQKMEKILRVTFFKMLPFGRQDEIDFLTRYWNHNLKLSNPNKNKCEMYAEALLNKMFAWVKSDRDMEGPFAAIPLQVRMLADIFQENIKSESTDWEGCKEFLNGSRAVPNLPRKFNIVELYDIFIEKKRDVFIDKGNWCGNTAANRALTDKFDDCLDYHRSLAMKVILAEKQIDLFLSCHINGRDMEPYVLKMGIVQKLGDEFQFVHRTFAEYFFAEIVLKELQLLNPNAEFQKILIDEILVKDEFYVVRAFLNRNLEKVVDFLSPKIFKNYQSISHKNVNGDSNPNIVFVLSKEGCVAVLRLIFKSIHFKGEKTKFKELFNITNKNINSLNDLQIIMRKSGVNFTDWRGYTPLHYAIQGGHIDMAKFLVEQGAKVISGRNFDHTVLHLAARSGDLPIIQYFVEHGIDINVRDAKGCTALHSVSEIGNLTTVKYLVELGSDINVKDNDGCTPLHTAVLSYNLDTVKYLIECGADIDSRDNLGCTVLHSAANSHNWDIVKYLMELGMEVNSKKRYGSTVLHSAIWLGDLDIVKYLVEHGADVKDDNCKALNLAAQYGKLDIVEYLVECGLDINASCNNTVLHTATRCANLDVIKFLMKIIGDINSRDDRGRTLLHSAVKSGSLDTIKYIVASGVDVNVRDGDGCTALHLAPIFGKLDTIKYLVECGIDINVRDNNGRTVLYSIIILQDLDVVRYFVDSGADVNIRDNNGHTALHSAVIWNIFDIVKYLVECGADVNSRDSDGRTILYPAVLSKNLDIIKHLVECGSDINSGDNNGHTVLHLAALSFGNLNIVKYLVELGANFKRLANDGDTVLHAAVRSGDLEITKYIVEVGLDVNVKNNNGWTILHSAARSGNLAIIKYLVELGADINSRDSAGNTVLHAAAKSRDLGTVKYIMDRGIDFRVKDNVGHTVLHAAARSANFDTVKYLMELGLDINCKDDEGYTPQDVAPFWCKKNIIEYIQKFGVKTSNSGSWRRKWYANLFKKKAKV